MRGKRQMPKLSIIAALDQAKGIGCDNKLLWHIPEDLARFRKLTSGHVVIMGRKTHESIGRPLPNRTNIVVTSNKNLKLVGCIVANSLEDALGIARQKEKEEIFIIGGGKIYEQTLPLADKLYLTVVEGNFGADTFFPPYEGFGRIVSQRDSSSGEYRFKFLEIERTKNGKSKS